MTRDKLMTSGPYKLLVENGFRLVEGYKFQRPNRPIQIYEYALIAHLEAHGFGGLLCDSHTDEAGEKEMTERAIVDHITNAVNDKLTVHVVDEPGAGGANHLYMIGGFDTTTNASDPFKERYGKGSDHTTILFQNGPIGEHGVNGITQEVLLAIVADRLRSFQQGPFSTKENAVALTHVETALLWLQKRTHDRMRRGVEGTNQK